MDRVCLLHVWMVQFIYYCQLQICEQVKLTPTCLIILWIDSYVITSTYVDYVYTKLAIMSSIVTCDEQWNDVYNMLLF